MSSIIDAAVKALQEKLGDGFDGAVKFVIGDEGAVVVGPDGVRAAAADEDADCTLSADAETFQAILSGDLDPTSAFMSGKLAVDGDMGAAMRLASALA
ncbi:MAG: sterol carrier family protein [Alphaproteobacteria bacterium]|nr:MAG: sterol carrier family protein [Alphaproteobacteria bacterium]